MGAKGVVLAEGDGLAPGEAVAGRVGAFGAGPLAGLVEVATGVVTARLSGPGAALSKTIVAPTRAAALKAVTPAAATRVWLVVISSLRQVSQGRLAVCTKS